MARSRWHTQNRDAWRRFRKALLDERGWRCARCGSAGPLELHHVQPLRDGGGEFDPDNCEILCRQCHIDHHRLDFEDVPERAEWTAYVRELAAGDAPAMEAADAPTPRIATACRIVRNEPAVAFKGIDC